MAGHSLGEWTALVASGVIDFKDALKLVRLRAESMQEAVKPGDGAMAAVLGLDDDVIVSVCKEVEKETAGVVAGVNFNSPGQVVIAGSTASVHRASEVLKEKGARKVQPLPVSVPSHCSLMLPASVKLSEALKNVNFNTPTIPVLHNFNVKEYSDTSLIKEALVKQLYMPVLWTQTINKIFEHGITKVVESGPGKVLSGLNKRINAEIVSYNIISDFETVLTELN
jgi:[acyl-carrier-protein] S-malonyltransferase